MGYQTFYYLKSELLVHYARHGFNNITVFLICYLIFWVTEEGTHTQKKEEKPQNRAGSSPNPVHCSWMLLKSQQKLKFHRKYLGIWIKITQIIPQNLNSNSIKLNFQVDSARFGGRVINFFYYIVRLSIC